MLNDERHINSYYKSTINLLDNQMLNVNDDSYSEYLQKSLMTGSVSEFKLSEVLLKRDAIFIQEQENVALVLSTEVEYKDTHRFEKYKLELMKNRLLILEYVNLTNKNKNKDKDKDTNNDSSSNQYMPKKNNGLLNSNSTNSNSTLNFNSECMNKIKEVNYYTPILVLDFDYITASMTLVKEKMEIKIYVLGTSRVFRIRVNNKEIYNKLAYAISIALSTSEGSRINLIAISLRNNWFKNYFISHRQFAMKAKTGDMLLFKGLECPSTCQRLITCDEYDHVVFLLRKQNKLFLYESTAKDGCKLKPWAEFTDLLWNLVHDKVVYRELIINAPNKDKIQILLDFKGEEFVNETIKKKYNISLCTIVCGGKKKKHEELNEWSQSKGFSCSSLVYAAYLYMKIIPYIRETGTVIPGHFSNKAKMKFSHPFELGPEIVINFSG